MCILKLNEHKRCLFKCSMCWIISTILGSLSPLMIFCHILRCITTNNCYHSVQNCILPVIACCLSAQVFEYMFTEHTIQIIWGFNHLPVALQQPYCSKTLLDMFILVSILLLYTLTYSVHLVLSPFHFLFSYRTQKHTHTHKLSLMTWAIHWAGWFNQTVGNQS